MSAWHYWWLISLNDDNEGLLLKGGGTTKRLYTMGNFSKFIRPGFQRIGISGPVPSGVQISAFKNPADGTIAVVAINGNSGPTSLPLFVSTASTQVQLTPSVTSSSDDLAVKAAITASNGGHFAATLADQSVTTFVGKP